MFKKLGQIKNFQDVLKNLDALKAIFVLLGVLIAVVIITNVLAHWKIYLFVAGIAYFLYIRKKFKNKKKDKKPKWGKQ